MKDNPDNLDLATPSIAFQVDDLERAHADPRRSRGAGERRGRPFGHAELRVLGPGRALVRGDAVNNTATPRIRAMTMTSVYPLYIEKVEKKGRTQDELDAAICWLTGYDESEFRRHLGRGHEHGGLLRAGADEPERHPDHRRGLRCARRDHRRPADAADPLHGQARGRTRQGQGPGRVLRD